MSRKPLDQPKRRLSFSERRAVILAAASEVLAANGYEQASMREIAKASEVTTPVLYDHFHSKIDLYLAVVRHHAEKLVVSWSEPPSMAGISERFKQSSRAFFSWIRQNEDSWRILFMDNPRDPAAIQAHQQVRGLATEAVAKLLDTLPPVRIPGTFNLADANLAIAAQLTGAGNALATWWWDNRDIPTETIVELNHELVWNGLSSFMGERTD
ncbi:TetR/AcrR family transcriptional regulator [Saccharothrix isguenensis]